MNYNIIIISLNFILIISPLIILYKLYRFNYDNKILPVLIYTSCVLFYIALYFIIPWGLFSIYLKYLIISFYILITIFLIFKTYKIFNKLPVHLFSSLNNFFIIIYSISIILFCLVVIELFNSRNFNNFIKLSFPLRGVNYYILDGGNSIVINQHYLNDFQKYAIDIIKLNKYKTHSSGFFPKSNNNYEIFGENIFSPCDGIVYDLENSIVDHHGPSYPTKNLAGNYILIKSEDNHYILLAHMQYKSIIVKKGQHVNTGVKIGKVGNTGNSSEPHLHIHAVEEMNSGILFSGMSLPILFDEKFLIRNDIVNY